MKQLKFTLLILSTLIMSAGCEEGNKIAFTKIVNGVNKTCPHQVDFLTTLESCEYVSDNKIKFNYIINTDMMNDNLYLFQQITEKQAAYETSIMMNQKKTQALKKLCPTIIYSYKDKAGKFLFEKEVTPEMYTTLQQVKMNKEELFELLKQNAELLTGKNQKIEEDVFLTSVNVIYPDTLIYGYTLPHIDVTEVDTLLFKEAVIPAISVVIKEDTQSQILKDHNIIFRSIYYGEDNAYICTIDLTPDMYK